MQVFNNYRRAQDDIRDHVIEWVVLEGSRGELIDYDDPLPLRDGWANTLYLGYQYRGDRLQVRNRVKWEVIGQSNYSERPVEQQNLRETASFVGVLNKIDYTLDLGVFKIQPRWKSEFLRQRPSPRENTLVRVATTELRELGSLVLRLPILSHTELQTGLEYLLVRQFREELKTHQLRSDRDEMVYALQFTNNAEYGGYDLWTQTGFRVSRIDRASADKARTETTMFVTIFAGVE